MNDKDLVEYLTRMDCLWIGRASVPQRAWQSLSNGTASRRTPMTEMTECEKEIIALKMRINWLQGERDFYREERDEARRMYCEEAFAHRFNERRFNERVGLGPIIDPKQIAQGMKWDCFKENTNE
jgi:hypothetical protein